MCVCVCVCDTVGMQIKAGPKYPHRAAAARSINETARYRHEKLVAFAKANLFDMWMDGMSESDLASMVASDPVMRRLGVEFTRTPVPTADLPVTLHIDDPVLPVGDLTVGTLCDHLQKLDALCKKFRNKSSHIHQQLLNFVFAHECKRCKTKTSVLLAACDDTVD